MEKQIIIFGTGEFADVLTGKLEQDGKIVTGYTVNEAYLKERTYNDKPVYAFETLNQMTDAGNCEIFIGTIGKHMLSYREKVYQEILQSGYHMPNYISSTAHVAADVIGNGNIIMENVVVEKHCTIGNGNIIWPNVVLPHHNKIGDFNNLSPSASLSGYSEVANHCFIGNNACLNNHVKVHDYALVGAGVFVSEDLDSEQVLVSEKSYILENKKSYDFK